MIWYINEGIKRTRNENGNLKKGLRFLTALVPKDI